MEQPHPIIQPFLNFLKFEKRYSHYTVISYQTDLTAFFDYLQTAFGGVALTQITHTYIRSWLAAQKQEGMSGKSLNRKISTLKSFFKYCVKTNAVTQTPMAKITSPKNEKRLPLYVAEKDVHTLLNHVEFADDWEGKTDRMVLQLFYATGMRLSELIGLKVGSINFSSSTIKVLGKGNKERVIPVSSRLMDELKEYHTKRKKLYPNCVTKELLITDKEAALPPRKVYSSVKKYLTLVTTIEKRSPHILRHSFATHLMNNGAGLNAVKELLGHGSLAATQVYTHNSIEKLKDVYKNAHPKA